MSRQKSWHEVERHFRDYYTTAPYYQAGCDWAHYAPAYRFGWQRATTSAASALRWRRVEPALARLWRGEANSAPWQSVCAAVQDAWERAQGGWGERPEPLAAMLWSPNLPRLLRAMPLSPPKR